MDLICKRSVLAAQMRTDYKERGQSKILGTSLEATIEDRWL